MFGLFVPDKIVEMTVVELSYEFGGSLVNNDMVTSRPITKRSLYPGHGPYAWLVARRKRPNLPSSCAKLVLGLYTPVIRSVVRKSPRTEPRRGLVAYQLAAIRSGISAKIDIVSCCATIVGPA